ncbi:MAG TPA: tyrosine-type recombinase/integrase [Acidovorax sp.]|nr:tyrosine-type recombinase/integrase [Acidovorax sp.]
MHEGKRCRETLTVAGKPLAPTAANVKYAHRVASEIRDKIRLGTFVLADFFPDSPKAIKLAPVVEERTFGKWCELWLQTKGRLAKRTLSQYTNALAIWQSLLGADSLMGTLTHATVAAKVGAYPWKSAKLLNNYLIPLRGVFALAGRELKMENPMEGIENSKHQAAAPDPLSTAEMERILVDLRERYDPRVHAYFEFAFLTGMRPEELIALRWGDVDWNHGTVRVERARTAGEVKELKTYNARDVDLVARAVAALQAMKPWTAMGGMEAVIFQNPVTNKPWHDERSQRDHYWTPSLRRLGIRRRRAYQTRHTYAANALAAGVNPAYIARQMGHKNAKMLFSVYAKWIDGADRGREKAKLEAALRNEKAAQEKAA